MVPRFFAFFRIAFCRFLGFLLCCIETIPATFWHPLRSNNSVLTFLASIRLPLLPLAKTFFWVCILIPSQPAFGSLATVTLLLQTGAFGFMILITFLFFIYFSVHIPFGDGWMAVPLKKQKTGKIDRGTLLKVAANSRLSLSEAEVKKFLPQMDAVLESFSKLDELDVSKERPSFQPIPLKNVFREDRAVPENCLSNEEALANTPHKKGGYFKGPKVV